MSKSKFSQNSDHCSLIPLLLLFCSSVLTHAEKEEEEKMKLFCAHVVPKPAFEWVVKSQSVILAERRKFQAHRSNEHLKAEQTRY